MALSPPDQPSGLPWYTRHYLLLRNPWRSCFPSTVPFLTPFQRPHGVNLWTVKSSSSATYEFCSTFSICFSKSTSKRLQKGNKVILLFIMIAYHLGKWLRDGWLLPERENKLSNPPIRAQPAGRGWNFMLLFHISYFPGWKLFPAVGIQMCWQPSCEDHFASDKASPNHCVDMTHI